MRTFEIHSAEIEPNHATTASVSNFASGRKSQEACPPAAVARKEHMQKPFFESRGSILICLLHWYAGAAMLKLLHSSLPPFQRGESTCSGFIFSGDSLWRRAAAEPTNRKRERVEPDMGIEPARAIIMTRGAAARC